MNSKKKTYFIPALLPLPPDWESSLIDKRVADILANFAVHQKRVCSIGVFIESYGFQNAAAAVEKLRRETNEDIGLLLVDGVFARDETFRAEVLKGRDWIKTIENVPHPALPQIFRQSQVFVRASEHESYGLSRIEAIWCSLPVIATNVGETRGMLIYDFADITALINHLRKVLAGNFIDDSKNWADEYRREAESNLKNYLRVITGNPKLFEEAKR